MPQRRWQHLPAKKKERIREVEIVVCVVYLHDIVLAFGSLFLSML